MHWDYFTTLSYKWDVKAKQCRRVMDNLTKELVKIIIMNSSINIEK